MKLKIVTGVRSPRIFYIQRITQRLDLRPKNTRDRESYAWLNLRPDVELVDRYLQYSTQKYGKKYLEKSILK